jgi:hypothetical protein
MPDSNAEFTAILCPVLLAPAASVDAIQVLSRDPSDPSLLCYLKASGNKKTDDRPVFTSALKQGRNGSKTGAD